MSSSLVIILLSIFPGGPGQALANLDEVIARKPEIDRAFEVKMDSIKRVYRDAVGHGKCLAADSLFYYYKDSNLDSANFYASERLRLYRRYGSEKELQFVRFEQMFSQSPLSLISNIEEFESIDTSWIAANDLTEKYLSTGAYLYRTALVNVDPRDSLYLSRYDYFYSGFCEKFPDTYRALALRLIHYRDSGNYEKVIELAKDGMEKYSNEWNRSVLAYYLGFSYEKLGQTAAAIRYFAESAAMDLECSKNHHNALSKLSHILAREGDNPRALRYLYTATEVTISSNYQHRFPEIAVTLANISDSAMKAETEKRRLVTILFAVSILALVGCVIALVLLYRFMRRIRRLNRQITSANRRLDEMNILKENYLMRYMVKCTEYIRKTDGKTSELKSVFKAGGSDALVAELRKPNYSDSEFKSFYSDFDSTFLRIFPSYLDVLNSKVQNGEKWTLGRHDALPMELRVLAVMRIGITDKDDIASFLNFPVSSIYTYTYKLRRSFGLGAGELAEFASSLNI